MAQLKVNSTVDGKRILNTDDLVLLDTLWVPASAFIPLVTNGAASGSVEKATNDIMYDYFAFDGATEEFVAFNVPMPENWNLGTIKAKFYWSSASGSTTNDTVEWEISGVAIGNNDVLDAVPGTSQVISDALLADNGANLQISGATPAITIGGTPVLGDLVHFKVSRNVSGSDDMSEDAWLFGVLIQFTKTGTAVSAW